MLRHIKKSEQKKIGEGYLGSKVKFIAAGVRHDIISIAIPITVRCIKSARRRMKTERLQQKPLILATCVRMLGVGK
jgi:hypothetical protein